MYSQKEVFAYSRSSAFHQHRHSIFVPVLRHFDNEDAFMNGGIPFNKRRTNDKFEVNLYPDAGNLLTANINQPLDFLPRNRDGELRIVARLTSEVFE